MIREFESIDTGVIDWGLNVINAPFVWDKTKGKGVKIALIDTGIDTTHPDLAGNVKAGLDLMGHTGNFNDEFGHGTHVAGIIAGKHTGVAPESDLYIAKVLDNKGRGDTNSVNKGISFAINFKVDILCMSLGMPDGLPDSTKSEIRRAYQKGITIISATGNRGESSINYPAFMDEVIAVGGIDKDCNPAKFSNFGKEMDVLAPAVDVMSTFKGNKYATMTGTSMASPFVAGGIALIISYYRSKGIELSPKEIKEMLSKLGSKKTNYTGYGVFDLSKLII